MQWHQFAWTGAHKKCNCKGLASSSSAGYVCHDKTEKLRHPLLSLSSPVLHCSLVGKTELANRTLVAPLQCWNQKKNTSILLLHQLLPLHIFQMWWELHQPGYKDLNALLSFSHLLLLTRACCLVRSMAHGYPAKTLTSGGHPTGRVGVALLDKQLPDAEFIW